MLDCGPALCHHIFLEYGVRTVACSNWRRQCNDHQRLKCLNDSHICCLIIIFPQLSSRWRRRRATCSTLAPHLCSCTVPHSFFIGKTYNENDWLHLLLIIESSCSFTTYNKGTAGMVSLVVMSTAICLGSKSIVCCFSVGTLTFHCSLSMVTLVIEMAHNSMKQLTLKGQKHLGVHIHLSPHPAVTRSVFVS